MSEVDYISQGLGKELRGLFAAALALAQIAAQRRAAQLREQATETGVAEAEARRRFETEQRTAALGIALPEAGMSPQQVAPVVGEGRRRPGARPRGGAVLGPAGPHHGG